MLVCEVWVLGFLRVVDGLGVSGEGYLEDFEVRATHVEDR